jgi:putative endonuclease
VTNGTKCPCVYILASKRNGTLYVGVTSDIARRSWEHKSEAVDSFTKRYAIHRLVYAEFHESMLEAILREKQIKKWRRAWKLELIERNNPQWRDLYSEILR